MSSFLITLYALQLRFYNRLPDINPSAIVRGIVIIFFCFLSPSSDNSISSIFGLKILRDAILHWKLFVCHCRVSLGIIKFDRSPTIQMTTDCTVFPT